jgi:hypothetical protein
MCLYFQTNEFFFPALGYSVNYLPHPSGTFSFSFLFSFFSFGFLFDLLVFYSTGVCCTTLQQTLRCTEF